MALPGKIFIALIEEDDPQRSFFRLKPVLVEDDGKFVRYTEKDAFPEDGCIRIVPDKGEAIHFKSRMRQIGQFVEVNLREHPYENNKIRTNKNYHGNTSEKNAYIIYSDVVSKPDPDAIYALVEKHPEEAENALLNDEPVATRVLLTAGENVFTEVWTYETDAAMDCFRLQRTDITVDPSCLQFFDICGINGRTMRIAVRAPKPEERPAPKPAYTPVAPEMHVEKRPERIERPVERPAEQPAPKAEEEKNEKPWISHNPLFAQSRPSQVSPRHNALAQLCGLNPRQTTPIRALIDEKWCESRMDQLGMPVAVATDGPAVDESQRIIDALYAMWKQPERRAAIVSALVDVEGLEEAMDARRDVLRNSAVSKQLTELEAQRLQMLDEIENVRKGGEEVRNALRQEIRREEAAALATAVERTKKAQETHTRLEEENKALAAQSESAKEAIASLTDGRFEERLNDYLINRHAADLLEVMQHRSLRAASAEGIEVDAEAMIRATRECFAAGGQPIDRVQAVNLLICAAQSPVVLFCGAPGTGKSLTAQLLSKVMGMDDEHLLRRGPGEKPLDGDAGLKRDTRDDLATAVILEDANVVSCEDMLRGLYYRADNGEAMIWATVQDGGHPVPAYLYDRAYTVRLSTEGYGTVWTGSVRDTCRTYPAVSMSSLRAAFAPKETTLPATVNKRMEKLRNDLGLMGVHISRRALRAVWDYCAAAIPLMQLEPGAVLDLAICQRILPAVLASAPIAVLKALPEVLDDLPRCKALLNQPMPILF